MSPPLWAAALVTAAAMLVPAAGSAASMAGSQHPVVATHYGRLRGTRVTLPGALLGPVLRFLGVPYAAAPTGPRRFQAPEPPASWPGVRNATGFAPVCPQPLDTRALPRDMLPVWFAAAAPEALGAALGEQSEDCLFLNLYVPAGAPGERGARGHGGSWGVMCEVVCRHVSSCVVMRVVMCRRVKSCDVFEVVWGPVRS